MSNNIRHATHNDLPSLIHLSSKFYEEFKEKGRLPKISRKRLMSFFTSAINTRSQLLLVAEKDGDVYAFLAAILFNPIFSEELACAEVALYCHPDNRGGSSLIRMLTALKEFAVENKADSLTLSHFEATPEVGKAYRKLGLEPNEITYTMKIEEM